MKIRNYKEDELVVNFHDACIYGRDLRILESSTAWLNDACLHYFLQRLQFFQNSATQQLEDTLCLDPSVLSFLMHQCDDPEELDHFLQGNKHFEGIRRFFLPINDNLNDSLWQTPGRGIHWSLLVAMEHGGSLYFHHFDSIAGQNSPTAMAVSRTWHSVWSLARSTYQSSDGDVTPHFRDCPTPQQANGYDCGLHVLGAVEALMPENGDADGDEIVARYFQRNPSAVCSTLRQRIAQDIRRVASGDLS